MKIQRIAITSLVLVAAGLTACSSTSKNDAEGSSTSVVDTTPGVTTAPLATNPPATNPPATNPPGTNPPGTNPPATNPPPTGHSLYDQVNGPSVPSGHTDPFASSGALGNGVYWVIYNGGETFTPDITVMQAFFSDECDDQASSAGETCENGIYVLESPSRDIDTMAFSADVNLTVVDESSRLSYWITPDELRTIRASSPSVDTAPDGVYANFPYLMTVQNGQITKFEQVWTP